MLRLRSSALALALMTGSMIGFVPQLAQAQIFIDIRAGFAPPPLPVYVQPPLPGPDYIWTPGYWAWDAYAGDYYWVPGTWVLAPRPGFLWTPAYWGWDNGVYIFHRGYWGEHIGYYGGINYGFGYTGFGFEGGYWSGPHYFYNRAVNNVTNVNITNVYNKTVIVNRTVVNNVSYSGGPGGIVAQPTLEQRAAEREAHIEATPLQAQHIQAARANRALFASANHGAPPVAASLRPAQFNGPGIVRSQRAPQFAAPIGGDNFRNRERAADFPRAPGAERAGAFQVPREHPAAEGRPEAGRPMAPALRERGPANFAAEPHRPPPPRPAPPRPQNHPRPPAPPHPAPHEDHRREH